MCQIMENIYTVKIMLSIMMSNLPLFITERNDEWAGQVRVHVDGPISDLHAADGRYHVYCMFKFMNKRVVPVPHKMN